MIQFKRLFVTKRISLVNGIRKNFYSTQSIGPLARYHKLVEQKSIKHDNHQIETVELLDKVFQNIKSYSPETIGISTTSSQSTSNKNNSSSKGGWFSSIFQSSSNKSTNETTHTSENLSIDKRVPKGIYLHGEVGTGKTFLMDLFYNECTHIKHKRRVHFHAFMLDVHKRIHQWRTSERSDVDYDPIPPLAEKLSNEAWLLCFDEFQVNDVADASILHRLFRHMYNRGAVVVSTSNRAPDDLYQNGLQRELFLPFIALTKEQNKVHCLDSKIDYRMTGIKSDDNVYFVGKEEANKQLDDLWNKIIDNNEPKPMLLSIDAKTSKHTSERTIMLQTTSKRCVLFDFDEVCGQAWGAAEYIAIANNFDTVFVRGVPELSHENKDLARRFITLIDELYEHRCNFVCSSAKEPKFLFSSKQNTAASRRDAVLKSAAKIESDLREELLEKRGVSDFAEGTYEESAMFTGDEEAFAFARAASRLFEMQTTQYMSDKWRGVPWTNVD